MTQNQQCAVKANRADSSVLHGLNEKRVIKNQILSVATKSQQCSVRCLI